MTFDADQAEAYNDDWWDAVKEPQDFERDWWGDCANTFGEETKQITYAHRMGLVMAPGDGHWPHYDMGGRTVVDLGGGPASILLKAANTGYESRVVDPCAYPEWTIRRYEAHGIKVSRVPAEVFNTGEALWDYDEAWIYNVLQHVEDPEKVVATAMRSAKVVRIFDWLDTPPHEGHPHEIKREQLDEWLCARLPWQPAAGPVQPGYEGLGFVEDFRDHVENGCDWVAYYGMFPTGR